MKSHPKKPNIIARVRNGLKAFADGASKLRNGKSPNETPVVKVTKSKSHFPLGKNSAKSLREQTLVVPKKDEALRLKSASQNIALNGHAQDTPTIDITSDPTSRESQASMQAQVPHVSNYANASMNAVTQDNTANNYAISFFTQTEVEDINSKLEQLKPVDLTGKIASREAIGVGAFGVVQRAKLNELIIELCHHSTMYSDNVIGVDLVTCIKELTNPAAIQASIHEAYIGEYINRQLKDKGIHNTHCNLSTLAYETSGEGLNQVKSYKIVSRYACHGNLSKYISDQYAKENHTERDKAIKIKTWMKEAITGLKNMHAVNVIHGDIALRNLLLGKDGIELADYGHAGILQNNATSIPYIKNETVPIRWCDSNRLNGHGTSKFSDIFAMKIALLWTCPC